MKKTLLVVSVCLLITTGLAHGQKSPPYNPKTGVYTIDWDTPKNQPSQKSTGNAVTPSHPASAAPQPTYPPGYWEQQKRLQDEEVARYEKRYQEKKAAEKAAIAKREAEERSRQEAEDKANRLASERDRERKRKRNASEDSGPAHSSVNRSSHGAVNPATGEFYAPAGAGNLVGTRDGTLFTPAGPNGYINTRTGQFVPAH